MPSLHRASRNKYRRYIQPHCGHEHTWSNLVAVAYAHHRIGTMGVNHVFHTVGNQVARRQRIKHPLVAHGDAVVNGNSVELGSETAQLLDFALHYLPHLMQMRMPWHKLSKRVDNGNDRLAHLPRFHAVGEPQCPRPCHAATLCRYGTFQWKTHI